MAAPSQQMIHGVILVLIGVAGYLWNPSKAISALIAGGLTGVQMSSVCFIGLHTW